MKNLAPDHKRQLPKNVTFSAVGFEGLGIRTDQNKARVIDKSLINEVVHDVQDYIVDIQNNWYRICVYCLSRLTIRGKRNYDGFSYCSQQIQDK